MEIGTAPDADLLVVGLVTVVVVCFTLAITIGRWPVWILGYVTAVVALGGAFFFRDPDRAGERGPDLFLAPADGRVLAVELVEEPDYLGETATRVSIFLSVVDVHVQRSPVTGVVEYVRRQEGRFGPAWSEEAGSQNESTMIGIDAGHVRVAVRQVAGLVARRIVTYAEEGDRLAQGQRLGLIRFGSRVDAYLPTDVEVRVRAGDRVRAATTVLAHRPAARDTL